MKVISLRYQPVEGGALGGHFALHVTLGGGDPASVFSASSLATKIHDCFQKLDLKSPVRGILLDCRQSDAGMEEMSSLIAILRDWGLFVNLWVGDETRYPWFEGCHITVFTGRDHWANFRVDEVRYILSENPALWHEPDIYAVNKLSVCYVLPAEGILGSSKYRGELLHFLTECRRPWGVILHTLGAPVLVFDLKPVE